MDVRDTLRRVARVYLLGFAVLAIAAGYWHLWGSVTIAQDPAYNAARLQAELARIRRGRILAADGSVLVEGQPSESRVVHDISLAHLLGYYSFRYGSSGVEQIADAQLTGSAGLRVVPGIVEDLLHLPREGEDVQLTIDPRLQAAAAAALGGRQGAVVVLDAHSGALLALVSSPSYNPATIDDDFPALRDNPGSPLLNRATQGLYAPGSTFKTVTLAGALRAGLARPDTPQECPGVITVEGAQIFNDNEPRGGGTRDLASAYQWSCNTAFARLGLALGAEPLQALARDLGFESVLPLDGLPVALSRVAVTPGFLDSEIALASTAYGQGELLVTPLQMALVAAMAANDGRVPEPHLLAGPLRGLLPWRTPLDVGSARQLADIMRLSGREGWARTASTPQLTVAGKTGTAEAPPGAPHAWYIGFAPADNPRVAFAVVLEHGGGGASVAGPVVAHMLAGWGALAGR